MKTVDVFVLFWRPLLLSFADAPDKRDPVHVCTRPPFLKQAKNNLPKTRSLFDHGLAWSWSQAVSLQKKTRKIANYTRSVNEVTRITRTLGLSSNYSLCLRILQYNRVPTFFQQINDTHSLRFWIILCF